MEEHTMKNRQDRFSRGARFSRSSRRARYSRILLLAACCLASCTDDGLLDGSMVSESDGAMTFVVNQKNMTRSALSGSHPDFGVYATASSSATTTIVMPNYLAGDASESGVYKAYGDFSKGSTQGWTYQALGNANTDKPTSITTPSGQYTRSEVKQQSLQYWNTSRSKYNFLAFTPYLPSTENTDASALTDKAHMVFDKDNNKMTFSHIHAFYTDPAKQTSEAIVSGKMYDYGYAPTTDISASNADLIINNEANYAGKEVQRASFGQEVPFSFQHLNSKIQVKFYSTVEGYDIKLTDLVPENTQGPGSSYLTVTPGIVFSPSTKAQSETPMDADHTQPALRELPAYNSWADIPITFNSSNEATITQFTGGNGQAGNAVSDNHGTLHFKPTTELLKTTQGEAEQSATVYYAIPNHNGTSYITQYQRESTDYVADNTGYTVHVSYEMVPKEGGSSRAHTKVFDARVWLSQDVCKWRPGYSYTYVFNIQGGNGITNTKTVDPANESEPWIDGTDPRVPTSTTMKPIIFYGVEVADYDGGGEEAHFLIEPTEESWGGNFTFNTQIYYFTISPIGNTYFTGYNMVEPSYVAEGVTRNSFTKNNTNYTTWTFDTTKKQFVYTYNVETNFVMQFNGISDPYNTGNYYAYVWTSYGVAMKLYYDASTDAITITDAKRSATWASEAGSNWDGTAYGLFIPEANQIPLLLDIDFTQNGGYYYNTAYTYTSYPEIISMSRISINDCTFNYDAGTFTVIIGGAQAFFTNQGTSEEPVLYLWSNDDELYKITCDPTATPKTYTITQENSLTGATHGNVIYKQD